PGAAASGAPAPAAAPAAPVPVAAAPAPAAPVASGPGMAAGAGQVQAMWPGVLEAVKNKRRFTWILLSQNAQVVGFDGAVLQLGFPNPGARDNFASSGSEDVLKQVLSEQFQVNWKIEAVVGGGQPAPVSTSYSAPPPSYAPPAPAPAYQPPQAQAPQQPAAPAYQPPPAQGHQQQPPAAPAPVPMREPVRPEDDVPEEDDPDLVDSALTGHDLIVRELGATVVEEYTND
ncbi:DNA polymerase III subunit gamma and tau, partial [Streptomyces sp. NPDC059917]